MSDEIHCKIQFLSFPQMPFLFSHVQLVEHINCFNILLCASYCLQLLYMSHEMENILFADINLQP